MAFCDFISHAAEGEYAKLAPLRILSFDIECAGRKGVFPEPEIDPVIQIANMVQIQGEPRPFVRNIFALDTCANIVGSQVGQLFGSFRLPSHSSSSFSSPRSFLSRFLRLFSYSLYFFQLSVLSSF